MADKRIFWSKTGLTGGEATKLDSIDGADLQDGEVAHVFISDILYVYRLDVDSGAAESSPAIIAPDTNAGDKRWILQSYYSGSGTLYTDHIAESTAGHGVEIDGLTIKDSGFALGSDADGDMYYRASSALARLAKGTASYKLFMNAGATAPEWGESVYISYFTRDAGGDAGNVTPFGAIGFTPRFGLFFSTHTYGWCIGIDNGTGHYSMAIYGADWKTQLYSTGKSIRAVSNDGGSYQEGYVSAWSANGPTITWTKTGSPSGTMSIMCALFR